MHWEWLELGIKKRIAAACFDTTKAPVQLCGTRTYHKGTSTTLWYQNIPQRHQYNPVVPKTYHKGTNTTLWCQNIPQRHQYNFVVSKRFIKAPTLWYQTIPQRHQYNFVLSKHTATILQQGAYKANFKLQWRPSAFFCDKICKLWQRTIMIILNLNHTKPYLEKELVSLSD